MAFQYNFLRLVPISIFHSTLQIRTMMTVEVLKYPIFVL